MSAAFFEAVLGNLAVAAGLAAIAFAVGRRLHRPAVGHALWLLVLLKMLTPPIAAISVPCLPAAVEPKPTILQPAHIAPIASIPLETPPAPSAIGDNALSVPLIATSEREIASAVPFAAMERNWQPSLLEVAAFAWGIGTAAALVLTIRRVRRFSRLLRYASPAPQPLLDEVAAAAERLGLRRVPRVRVVPGKLSPFVWFVGRPTLFLPGDLMQQLAAEQRHAVLLHELVHLRRWDHIVRLVEVAALAAYWWCPLAWLARRELRRLEEEACDAGVLTAMPGASCDYAEAILATIDYLAGAPRTPAFAAGMGGAASMRQRLLIILNAAPAAPLSSRSRFLLIAVGLACLVAAPKMTRLAAKELDLLRAPFDADVTVTGPDATTVDEVRESLNFVPRATIGPRFNAPVAASASHGPLLAVAIGPDVAVSNVRTRQLVLTLTGHTDAVTAIAFSPDGSRIATTSDDGTARTWNSTDGRKLAALDGRGKWMKSVAFSPDGRTLVTGGYDKTVRLWNAASGAALAAWSGHTGGIRAVAFSPNGQFVASGGAENIVRLWDATRGIAVRHWKHDGAVNALAFSPDGTLLASGGDDRMVRFWQTGTGRESVSPVALPDAVTTLSFTDSGFGLVAGTKSGHLVHINPQDGQVRGYLGREPGQPVEQPAHIAGIVAIQNLPATRSLRTIAQDGTTLIWTVATLQTAPAVFRTEHAVGCVALAPEGTLLAIGGRDGAIRLWDAKTARFSKQLPGHPGGVRALVFGSHGRLVSAGADERIRIWDTASGQVLHALIQPTTDQRLAMSPDGSTLAIGGGKSAGIGFVRLAEGGRPRRIGQGFGEVTALAFTPRGGRIAAGYADGAMRLLDVATGEELVRGRVAGPVSSIAFDPTASTAAIVVNAAPAVIDEEETPPRYAVEFLDVRDGSSMGNYQELAHPGPIAAATFAARGQVLTAAGDGNLYLWDPRAGRPLRTIRGHADAVRDVAMAPDRTTAFSAGDRAVKKWLLVGE
ncbi:MAG TPA: M56 family metallopeptidase [Urbifossiella sp.]|nr:M56 family metallopeptidase [Urbifossiella sp.]